MTYSAPMPSMEAIQRAVREPLSDAPHECQKFAIYIFKRAREIDRELASKKSDRASAPEQAVLHDNCRVHAH
jgi:hypothetical protein